MTIFLMSVSLVVATLLGVWGTSRFPRFFPMYFFVLVPLDMLWLNEYYILTYRPESLLDVPIILKVIKDIVWLIVLLCFALWRFSGRRSASFPRDLALPILLFVGYQILQAIRGYFSIGLVGELLAVYKNLLYIPAAYLAIYLIRAPSDLRLLARRFAYLMLAASAYGFVQMTLQLGNDWPVKGSGALRPGAYSSFFLSYDQLGWFACTVFALILLQKEAFKEVRWLYWLTLGTSLFWAVASQSRTAIVALCAVVGVLVLRRRVRGAAAFGLAGVLGFLGAEATQLIAPVGWLQGIRIFTPSDNVLLNSRFTIAWPYLWHFFAERPLVGSGLGLFGFETYQSLYPGVSESFAGADNTYLLVALTGGLIGLGLFLFMLFRLLRVSVRTSRAPGNPDVTQAAAGLLLALVVSLVYFFPTDFLDGFPMSLYIWFLIGAIGGVANLAREMRLGRVHPVPNLP